MCIYIYRRLVLRSVNLRKSESFLCVNRALTGSDKRWRYDEILQHVTRHVFLTVNHRRNVCSIEKKHQVGFAFLFDVVGDNCSLILTFVITNVVRC